MPVLKNVRDATGLAQYKVLLFDCYGTLVDWERGMYENLQPIFTQKTCPDVEKVFKTLSVNEARMQNENKTMPYPMVLAQAYYRVTGELRLAFDPDAAQAFGESVGSWPAFPDSAEALGRLKQLGLKLVVLSNVDNHSFSETRKKLETGWGSFDAAYVAEDIGTYKPDLRNFQYALEHLDATFGILPSEVISVANSLYHDIMPAHKMGLNAVWINRDQATLGVKGHEGPQPDWTYGSMAEFADVMEGVHGKV